MTSAALNYCVSVQSDWVDYNGHMNDAAYAKVFSLAADEFIEAIGLDTQAREKWSYTIFTLETHLCYLKEAHENEELNISAQLLDNDSKRLHVFFAMKNAKGEQIATSEQMLMGMNSAQGKPAAFPESVLASIGNLKRVYTKLDLPKQVGRTIGIRR